MGTHAPDMLPGFYEAEVAPGVIFSMIDAQKNDFITVEDNTKSDNSIEFSFVISGEVEVTDTSMSIRKGIHIGQNENIACCLPDSFTKFTLCRSVHSKIFGIRIFISYLYEIIGVEKSKNITDILPINKIIPLTAQQKLSISQLFNYKQYGVAQKLFLHGKAIELLSMKIDEISRQIYPSQCKYKNVILSKQDINKIQRARIIQKERMASPPSVRELADLCGLNVNKIKKGFWEIYGKTPFECLHEERMQHSYALLLEGNVSVSEVAWQIGYTHVGHFSSAFFKRFGMKPKEFQQAIRLTKYSS